MVGGRAAGLVVDDEVDTALAPQLCVFGAMPGHLREAELFEQGLQQPRLRGGKLDELEAVQAHGVVAVVAHGGALLKPAGILDGFGRQNSAKSL